MSHCISTHVRVINSMLVPQQHCLAITWGPHLGHSDSCSVSTDFCFDLSKLPPSYIIAVDWIVDNTSLLHHNVIEFFDRKRCKGASSGPLVGWAPGVAPNIFPPNAGLKVGKGTTFLSFKMQNHCTQNAAHAADPRRMRWLHTMLCVPEPRASYSFKPQMTIPTTYRAPTPPGSASIGLQIRIWTFRCSSAPRPAKDVAPALPSSRLSVCNVEHAQTDGRVCVRRTQLLAPPCCV